MTVSPTLRARDSEAIESGHSDQDPAFYLRTQFLRRVAHDIASPSGVTLTVLEELAGLETQRPELLAMARRSLRRLMRLSEHLALVAELESGTLEPEFAVVDLRALVRESLDDALAVDGRKDVVTACDLPSTPLSIVGDARLLHVALREIVGNALKLASSRVEVSVRAADGDVIVRVDDDGPGLPPDALATLGHRFVRRTASRGLGLSLSMAIEVLRHHDATLDIEPSPLPAGRRGAVGTGVVVRLACAPQKG